jgi:hypothetical protein
MSERPYNVIETLEEFDAGTFAGKLSRAVADVALGVMTNGDKGKKGKVTITLDFSRVGETSQVNIDHTVAYSKPTKRGKSSEEDTTATVMYVGRGGHLSVVPHTQGNLFANEKKETA